MPAKTVRVSHRLNGELHVPMGNQRLHPGQMPIEHTAGRMRVAA